MLGKSCWIDGLQSILEKLYLELPLPACYLVLGWHHQTHQTQAPLRVDLHFLVTWELEWCLGNPKNRWLNRWHQNPHSSFWCFVKFRLPQRNKFFEFRHPWAVPLSNAAAMLTPEEMDMQAEARSYGAGKLGAQVAAGSSGKMISHRKPYHTVMARNTNFLSTYNHL